MSWGKGYRTQMLLAWETVYGTDPSSVAAYKVAYNTEDLSEDQPNQHSNTIRNNRNPVIPFLGNKDVSGTIVVPVELTSAGIWLKGAFGSPVTTGSVSPYSHVFKIGNTIPSAVIDIGHADLGIYYKYNGCKINTYSMTIGGDGELLTTLGVSGAGETKGTSAVDAAPTDMSAYTLGKLYNNQASAEEASSAISYLTDFSFEVNNGLAPAYCIGDAGKKSQLGENIASVTGTITGLFQDDDLLLKGRNQTETSLQIALTSGSYSITYLFPEVVLSHKAPPIPGPEGLVLSLDFESYFQDSANESAIQVTLVNTTASY